MFVRRWKYLSIFLFCSIIVFHFIFFTDNQDESESIARPFLTPPASLFKPTDVTAIERPLSTILAKQKGKRDRVKSIGASQSKQILFGDMHVHTSLSADAALVDLAKLSMGKSIVSNPGMACDVARYCSGLDFWALTDHAEGYLPSNWIEAKASVRQCNAVSGDPKNPDMVSFMGFEWSGGMDRVYSTADFFGHHNVYFLGDKEDQLPMRPIGASKSLFPEPSVAKYYSNYSDEVARDYWAYFEAIRGVPVCSNSSESDEDCYELASSPEELMEKLDKEGFDRLIIPHGTAWGTPYKPEQASLENQLDVSQRPLELDAIEIFSGHGNSEQYFDVQRVAINDQGKVSCPAPHNNYLPPCWQAGEIVYKQCMELHSNNLRCGELRAEVRNTYIDKGEAGVAQFLVNAAESDWLDAGQVRGAFLPTFDYRPKRSIQAGLAQSNLDDPDNPIRFRWGFIGSTDTHDARPAVATVKENVPAVASLSEPNGFLFLFPTKSRMPSFRNGGGLAAVHSEGRSREEIWAALKRKEIYATSGDRILLWFDLVKDSGNRPMGSELSLVANPRFKVRALGDFKQLPGCPNHSVDALGPEKLDAYCANECYNPSSERRRITRIEVVRIQPQISKKEKIADLIQDPWKTLQCDNDNEACSVEFSDPEYSAEKRDTLYYVRAIQEPTKAINGGNLQTEFDQNGNPIAITLCSLEEGCPAMPAEERAWSSPIYINYSEAQITDESKSVH